jgi:hypothetical protein
VKARRVKKLDPSRSLGENAARIVSVRLDELLELAPKALDRESVDAQHDLRIASKRLRYVLEMTAFCFGRSADTARRRARDLQGILGEMHDCDVMLPRVREHLAELEGADVEAMRKRAGGAPDLDPGLVARAPNRTVYRGVELLAVHLQARRQVLFDRFLAFWGEQEQKGTWRRLARAVDRYLERARQARRAAKEAERARAELEARERAHDEAAARAVRAEQEREQARRRLTPRRRPSRRPG